VGCAGSTRNVEHLRGSRGFELVVEDVLDWAGRASLRDTHCVFHLAASKMSASLDDPERDLAVNALASLRLVQAAARDGVRKFVHGSTGSVYGRVAQRHDSATPTVPISYYGVSKLAGESYCRVVAEMAGMDCTVLRFYHVIGPRQDSSERGGVVAIFARQALSGETITIDGDGEQTRSFTSVHDIVRANIAAAESELARGTLSCASGLRVSIRELADYVIAETRSRSAIRHGPQRPGDVRSFDVDAGQLRSLGIEPSTDWRAMVRDVVAEHAERRAA
jgi:UDP-glucose 4-epimerase